VTKKELEETAVMTKEQKNGGTWHLQKLRILYSHTLLIQFFSEQAAPTEWL